MQRKLVFNFTSFAQGGGGGRGCEEVAGGQVPEGPEPAPRREGVSDSAAPAPRPAGTWPPRPPLPEPHRQRPFCLKREGGLGSKWAAEGQGPPGAPLANGLLLSVQPGLWSRPIHFGPHGGTGGDPASPQASASRTRPPGDLHALVPTHRPHRPGPCDAGGSPRLCWEHSGLRDGSRAGRFSLWFWFLLIPHPRIFFR